MEYIMSNEETSIRHLEFVGRSESSMLAYYIKCIYSQGKKNIYIYYAFRLLAFDWCHFSVILHAVFVLKSI